MSDVNRNTTQSTRLRRGLVVVIVLALLGVTLVPWFMSKTRFRDRILASIVNDPQLAVSAQDASFAWFRPVTVDGLLLQAKDNPSHVSIGSLKASRSWIRLVGAKDLGRFQVNDVVIDVTLDDPDDELTSDEDFGWPNVDVTIENLTLIVREPSRLEPVVELHNLASTVRLDNNAGCPVVELTPTILLDRRPLAADHCRSGLQLVAPILADELDITGAVSLKLDRLRMAWVSDTEETAHDVGDVF